MLIIYLTRFIFSFIHSCIQSEFLECPPPLNISISVCVINTYVMLVMFIAHGCGLWKYSFTLSLLFTLKHIIIFNVYCIFRRLCILIKCICILILFYHLFFLKSEWISNWCDFVSVSRLQNKHHIRSYHRIQIWVGLSSLAEWFVSKINESERYLWIFYVLINLNSFWIYDFIINLNA